VSFTHAAFGTRLRITDDWRNIVITLTTTARGVPKLADESNNLSGVVALVVLWTIIVHAQSHWNPVLAYLLYPGEIVSLLVTGGHGGTLTQDKVGFAVDIDSKPAGLFAGYIPSASSD
jgi:hypothetical protein